MRGVDARAEARRDQRRGVALLDDGGALEGQARARAGPARRTASRRSRRRGSTPAGCRCRGAAPAHRRPRREDALPARQRAHRGEPQVHQLHRRRGQIVAVEPPVLGVERGDQRAAAARAVIGPSPERAGQLEALVLVAQVRARARTAVRSGGTCSPASQPWAWRSRSVHAGLEPRHLTPRLGEPALRDAHRLTNVARMSVSSRPQVESTPGRGGTTTMGMSSSSASRQA